MVEALGVRPSAIPRSHQARTESWPVLQPDRVRLCRLDGAFDAEVANDNWDNCPTLQPAQSYCQLLVLGQAITLEDVETVIVIAVVCALAVGQDAQPHPATLCGLRLLLMLGGVVVCGMTARLVAILGCDSSLSAVCPSARRIDRWDRLHLGIWVVVCSFLIFVVDWITIVRTNWGLDQSILGDELLIVLPLLLPWAIAWWWFYDMDVPSVAPRMRRLHYVLYQLRMVVGLGLVPVFSVCLVGDVVRRWNARWLDGPWSSFLYLSPLALVVIAYPYLLMWLWKMVKLPPGKRRELLTQFAELHGIRIRNLLVWNTHGQLVNAAATGVLPRWRFVFFTDQLLENTTPEETLAIFAHEVAHLRYQHVLRRTMVLLLPLSLVLTLSALPSLLPPADGATARLFVSGSDSTNLLAPTLGVLGTLVFMVVGLSRYSRMLEHQADVWACQHLPAGSPGEAVNRYVQVLGKLHGDAIDASASWLHPSWKQRCVFVQRSLDDPGFLDAFQFRLKVIAVVSSGFALAALLLRLVAYF